MEIFKQNFIDIELILSLIFFSSRNASSEYWPSEIGSRVCLASADYYEHSPSYCKGLFRIVNNFIFLSRKLKNVSSFQPTNIILIMDPQNIFECLCHNI